MLATLPQQKTRKSGFFVGFDNLKWGLTDPFRCCLKRPASSGPG